MVIGIIGRVGTGKSAAIKHIEENYDTIVFSCDLIAKEMIDKKEVKLGFNNLNGLITNKEKSEYCRTNFHPLVFSRIGENISQLNLGNIVNKNNFREKIVIIESALPSNFLYDMCDKVICLYNDEKTSIERLKEHRNYSEDLTKSLYKMQDVYEEYYNKADYKILNDGSKDDLIKKLDEVLDEIHLIRK